MSLTRAEWLDLWERTKRLEHAVNELPPHIGFKKFAKAYVRHVKGLVQKIVGQLE